MFVHGHPYPPFIPDAATRLIVGTIPPPRFSTGDLFDDDVDFCYGSKHGLLWPILDDIFQLQLSFENTQRAIEQRKQFLQTNGIGICDMVAQCYRDKMDASDLGMREMVLRNLIDVLARYKKLSTILFMGGNSRNGPEYLFRSHLRSQGIELFCLSKDRPKIHEFFIDKRRITTVSLISPSSAANRSIGSDPFYKSEKQRNPSYSTLNFRIEQYKRYFR